MRLTPSGIHLLRKESAYLVFLSSSETKIKHETYAVAQQRNITAHNYKKGIFKRLL